MKKNLCIKTLLAITTLCLSTTGVLAAANLNGTWKGIVNKVTDTACAVPTTAVVSLSQCGAASNLFKGTLKIGTNTIKIVGRLDSENNFRVQGSEFSLTSANIQTALMIGKFIPASSKIRINEFQFITSKSALTGGSGLNEMYDVITLSK